MKMYLLLRDNIETGPYDVEDLRKMHLQKFDLIWINEKSITWKYPSELNELRQFAPKAELTYASIVNNQKEEQIKYFREYSIDSDYKKMNISYINEPDAFTSNIPEGYEYLIVADKVNKYGGNMSISGNAFLGAEERDATAEEAVDYNLIGEKQKVETAEIVADHQQFTTVIHVKQKQKSKTSATLPLKKNKNIMFNVAGMGLMLTTFISQFKL